MNITMNITEAWITGLLFLDYETYRWLDLKNAELWLNMTFQDGLRLFRESVYAH